MYVACRDKAGCAFTLTDSHLSSKEVMEEVTFFTYAIDVQRTAHDSVHPGMSKTTTHQSENS